MKSHKLYAIMLLLVLACSCGKSVEVTKEKEVNSKKVNLPAIGIVSQVKKETFALITLPEKLGDQPGETVVDFSKASVVDSQGKNVQLKQDSTVNIEGNFDEKILYASKITVTSAPTFQGASLPSTKKLSLRTAELIKRFLGNKLPENFGNDWELERHGSLAGKQSSKMSSYKKGDWQIILVNDPTTPDKFEVTVYGPNKFVWVGKQTSSDIIVESK